MPEHRSSIDIEAEADRVFDYLVTAEGLAAWLGDWARVSPVVGGEFAVDIAGYGARGVFLEVDRPRSVTVSWGFEGSDTLPPGASTVSFALTPTASGTTVEVVHTDLPEGEVAGHVDGWTHFVPRLAAAATGTVLAPTTWTPSP